MSSIYLSISTHNRFTFGGFTAISLMLAALLVSNYGNAEQPYTAYNKASRVQQSDEQADEFVDDLDDDFDNIEAKLEADFLQTDAQLEARYNAVHLAIQKAYTKQTAKIEVVWPNDSVVPSGAVWVAYSDDYEERVIYDFEQGFYQIEVIKSEDTASNLKRLSDMAETVTVDRAQTLNKLDVFSRAIKQEVARIAPSDTSDVANKMPSNTTQGLFTNLNYQIMASVSAPAPKFDVDQVLKQLAERKRPAVNPELIKLVDAKANKPEAKVQEVTKVQTEQVVEEKPLNMQVENSQAIMLTAAGEVLNKPELSPQTSAQVDISETLELSETQNGWSLKIPFVNNFQQTLVDQRMQTINAMSKRYDVDVSLILAIIEAESSFNPMATSPIPAFGLMQLVPKTAGIDAYRHVYGQRRLLTPEYLYDVGNNLELGTAYIDLLQSRYLRGIKDPKNKLYSMVASYNTGVGNLAKTVTGKKHIRKAISQINDMQPSDYYKFLQANLPAIETKRYLDKIISKRLKYQHLDNH